MEVTTNQIAVFGTLLLCPLELPGQRRVTGLVRNTTGTDYSPATHALHVTKETRKGNKKRKQKNTDNVREPSAEPPLTQKQLLSSRLVFFFPLLAFFSSNVDVIQRC